MKKYNKSVITDFNLFGDRGHSLASDYGWKEIAEYSLSCLNKTDFDRQSRIDERHHIFSPFTIHVFILRCLYLNNNPGSAATFFQRPI
jgi:hypothetical protein